MRSSTGLTGPRFYFAAGLGSARDDREGRGGGADALATYRFFGHHARAQRAERLRGVDVERLAGKEAPLARRAAWDGPRSLEALKLELLGDVDAGKPHECWFARRPEIPSGRWSVPAYVA